MHWDFGSFRYHDVPYASKYKELANNFAMGKRKKMTEGWLRMQVIELLVDA